MTEFADLHQEPEQDEEEADYTELLLGSFRKPAPTHTLGAEPRAATGSVCQELVEIPGLTELRAAQ